ncbi:putative ribonuclease H-like domain-containing protein [Tanacetum coccineum]
MKTPMSSDAKLTKDEECELIPLVARFQEDPKTSHLEAIKSMFQYIKGTTLLGLWYPKGTNTETVVYADSDQAEMYVGHRRALLAGIMYIRRMLSNNRGFSDEKTNCSRLKPEGYDLISHSADAKWNCHTYAYRKEVSSKSRNDIKDAKIDQGLGSTSGIRACALRNFDLEVMELENTQNNALAKLPMLKLGEYEMWEIRIKQYFQIQDYALWEVIENGNSWAVKIEDASEKAMCAIDGVGFDWSDMAEEEIQANMALMAFLDSEGLAIWKDQIVKYREHEVRFSEEIALLKRSVGSKEYQLGLLRTELEKITDKSKKGVGYNAVPSPHPLILNRPTPLDLSYSGLEEFKEPKSLHLDDEDVVGDPVVGKKATVILCLPKIEKPVGCSKIMLRCSGHKDPKGNNGTGNGQKNPLGLCSRHMTGKIAYLSDFKDLMELCNFGGGASIEAGITDRTASYIGDVAPDSDADAQIQDKDGLQDEDDATEKFHDDSSLKDNGTAIQQVNTAQPRKLIWCRELVLLFPEEEPKRVSKALSDPAWVEAMQEELLQFKLQKVWILVDLPKGHRAIVECIYYDEVFAPVARIEAIRMFLAYASYMGFMVYQMDVKSAFLYGQIEEEIGKALVKKEIAVDVDSVHVPGSQVSPKESTLSFVKESLDTLKGKPSLGLLASTKHTAIGRDYRIYNGGGCKTLLCVNLMSSEGIERIGKQSLLSLMSIQWLSLKTSLEGHLKLVIMMGVPCFLHPMDHLSMLFTHLGSDGVVELIELMNLVTKTIERIEDLGG